MEYQLAGKDETGRQINTVHCLDNNTWIPFAPDNTDYQKFKAQILADEAQLQDADGNVMTDAKDYVRTLP